MTATKRARRRRSACAAAVIMVLGWGLTGCSPTIAPASPPLASSPPSASDAAPAWQPQPVPADAVLASGPVLDAEGATIATIEIVTDGARNAFARFSRLDTSDPRPLQGLLRSTPGAQYGCFNSDGYGLGLPSFTPDVAQEFPLGRIDQLPSDDPSFLDEAVIYAPVTTVPPEGFDGCYGDVIGIAALSWTHEQSVPRLTDGGARQGASGSVSVTDAGTPLFYDVVPGDTLTNIAERFGVDPAVIVYLSAGRISPEGIVDDSLVYAGERLVLDAAAR